MKLFWCAALAAGALSAQTFSGAAALDQVINQAIEQGRMPGAVLLVGHEGKVVYRKAYGKRALVPQPEAMTLDTVFDCASLTKVVATTSSLMKLFEEGRFRLNDKITDYIPEFQGGKSDITLRQLFTHFSGLQPDVPLTTPWTGYDTGIKLACTFKPGGPPATRYVYSDINFILLGELVHRLSGKMLSEYARENIFLPLGMKESMFQPPASLLPRIAPTERWPVKTGPPLRGVVHDPTARNMGGVAGHAGLFSTADDLSRFAQMMLNGGELDGVRLFGPLTVAKFIEPQTPPDQPILRGLGWDVDSPHSGNRGELFPIGSFGHTGFTGTSHVDRPADQDLRDPAGQQRASRSAPRADAGARQGGDDCGRQRGTARAARDPDGIQRDSDRPRRAPPGGAQRRHADRPRRAGRDEIRAVRRQAHRPDHQPERARPAGPAQYRPDARGRREHRRHLLAGARLPRARKIAPEFRTPPTPPPASRSSASTAPPIGPRRRC